MFALGLLLGVAWLPLPSGVSMPRWGVALVGSALLWMLGPPARALGAAHAWGLALLAWAALSLLWSASPADTLGALTQLAALAAIFAAGAGLGDERMPALWTGLGTGATLLGLLGLAQMLDLTDFAEVAGQAQWTYPVGTAGNKNFLAVIGTLALFGLLFMRTPLDWSRARCAWASAITAGSAVAAFTPLCRGAMVAVVLAPLGWFLRGWKLWVTSAALVTSAAMGVLGLQRVPNSIQPRLEVWDWTASNLGPLGWGLGTYGSVFPWEHANNDLLEVAFELGIGALLLVGLLVACLRVRPRGLAAEWVVLCAAVVMSLSAFPLHQGCPAAVAALCAGRLAGARGRADRRQPLGRGCGWEGVDRARPLAAGAAG